MKLTRRLEPMPDEEWATVKLQAEDWLEKEGKEGIVVRASGTYIEWELKADVEDA